MTRAAFFLAAFLGLAGLLSPAPVAAQSGLDLLLLDDLARTDPEAALKATDERIAEVSAEGANILLLFDLFRLRVDLALALERKEEAIAALLQMANTAHEAEKDPESLLREDPVAILSEAIELLEEAGALRQARSQMRTRIAWMVERLQPAPAIAAAYEDLARLSEQMGDTAGAANAREAATTALIEPKAVADAGTRGTDEGYRAVDVYYATDRARDNERVPTRFYGGERGTLELGVASVTIPNIHSPGMVESPSIWRLEFAPNPARHVVLRSVMPLEKREFYERLSGEFDDTEKTEAFVFVHGFNVTFDQAAKRAAQMAYDMEYPAVPILYSWPSRGSTLAYIADTAVVRLSGRRMAGFLSELVEQSGATTIHLVAHSMGNRALTDALEILALQNDLQPGDDPLFGQVLFAAPDVDAGLFARMVQTIRPIAQRLTLYASEKDWALVSSRKLHGNAPRAGQGGEVTLANDNVDSIDMSELGEDMLAHSYFADDSSALADMVALFWQDADPDQRCGLEAHDSEKGQPPVWIYRRGQCATRNLIGAFAHLRAADVHSPEEVQSVLTASTTDPGLIALLEPVLMQLLFP